MATKKGTRSVLIALSQGDGLERVMLAGLYQQLMRRPGLSVCIVEPERLTAENTTAMPLDAMVGRIAPAVAERMIRRLPLILTTHGGPATAMRVVTDDAGVGRAAADYFLERGFEHFAYVGGRHAAGGLRYDAFAARLAECGRVARTYLGPDTGVMFWSPMAVDPQLTAWVRDLPAPAAVLAESDLVAFRVSEICRHYRIAIPDQISLLGVGNDELMCRLCHPALTTIATPAHRIGLTVADLLEQLLDGRPPAVRTVTLPQAGVVERQSANLIRTDDAEVAGAPRYIRTHAQKPIAIDDIVAAALTSRRTLERRFRRVLGQSLQAVITQVRMERAKILLAYSRSPIDSAARLSGFSSTQRFHLVFRRATGVTPQAYRQQLQKAPMVAMSAR